MESLRGLPEHIEADFGDSIVARDEAIAVLGATPGLGPPDLCWLQKCQKKTGLFGSSGEAQGYYHFVLGRDVSSSAAVAAYFALLNSKIESRGWQLMMSPDFVIERGFYCCYEPISRMDIRCELCVPGGVVVGAVDATGQLHDATPQLWQQAQVSAFVRSMLYDPEMRLNGGSVIAYDPCATAAGEASLLCSVLDLYNNGALPGGLQDIDEDMGFGVSAEHTDLVLAALWQHFRRRQRWEAAADFFRELMQTYSPAALLVAAAERAQSSAHGTKGSTLSELLLSVRPARGLNPQSSHTFVPTTMVGLGHEMLEQGESEAAASLARRALAQSPRCRPAWLLLAKCFVAERQYAAALVALNVVPTPPLPAAEVELLHVVPPPAPKDTTKPQVHLYDGELEAARWCALEEASLDGSRLLAYLPGSILVNKEPLGTAFQLDVCPNRVTRSVLTAVYDLLQEIVKELSWDRFLEVRSRVFLMQHEVAQSPAHNNNGGLSTRHSVSSEITPAGQPHDSSPHQELAALQAAQQAALLRKLEQLGLSADTPQSSPPHSSPPEGLPAPVVSSPVRTSGGGGTPAGGSGGGVRLVAAPGSSTGPTPPASRGRLSSGGGGASHRGGGSPQSYYANRLQEELARPHARASSSGGSAPGSAMAGAGPLPYSQLGVKVPADQQQQQQQQPAQPQQQQQQQQRVTSPSSQAASPGSAGSAAAAAAPSLRAPGTPGAGQRSMAGRVLLLGKKTAAHSTSSSRPPSARSVAPVGCGVPRSLAPNEVEDLSKYATASKVASLRVPAAPKGVTDGLWNAVFGGASNSSNEPAAAAPAAPEVSLTHKTNSSADSDDGLSAAAAGLPRIRTRPVAEQVEEECWLDADVAAVEATATDAFACGAARTVRQYRPGMRSFLQAERCSCGAEAFSSRGSSAAAAASSSRWRFGRAAVRSGGRTCATCSSSSSDCRQQQQPLGEGLDRTASLLNRTTSNLSTGAGISGQLSLPRAGSLRQGASISAGGLHSANSGSLSARGSRRLSLVGEAANRSLEADREGLTKGWVHDDVSAQAGWGGVDGVGSPGAGGRRLCVRWLDELIVALWHDLQAHMEWKVVDQTLRETRGGTAAELVMGLAHTAGPISPTAAGSAAATPTTAAPGVSNGGTFEPPVLTCADWMRRGALAERLGHTLDARSAYSAAVKVSFNMTAYLALLRLEAAADSIANTALCASEILNWHHKRAGQPNAGNSSGQGDQSSGSTGAGSNSSASAGAAAGSGGLVLMGMPPADVTWGLGLVADISSVDVVRRGMADVPPAAQAMLGAILDEWQRWQQVKVQPALAARQLRR